MNELLSFLTVQDFWVSCVSPQQDSLMFCLHEWQPFKQPLILGKFHKKLTNTELLIREVNSTAGPDDLDKIS